MQRWQRVAIIGVVAWLLAVVMWANRSWTETVSVVTPVGAPAQSRTFVCGAPLGSKTVDTEVTPPSDFPLARQACDVHGERRILAVVDVVVGVVLIAGLVYLGRRSAARREDALVD